MNAIIGDNGIITRAQEANIQSSIASLEEFLQLKYTENYEEMSKYQSKIEGLVNVCPDYFYIPADEGWGALRYVIDSEGHALYLVKKSGLPEEIKESLVGGDAGAGDYGDYQSLNDVYGVTSNLKVYYCSSGVDSIKGLAKESLDNDNPKRTIFELNSQMADFLKDDYDTDGDGTINAKEIKSVTSLEITKDSGITDLHDLYNLISLERLYLKNVNLPNLEGIQNVSNLSYVWFEGYGDNVSTIGDYTSLSGVKNLQYLYLYKSSNEQVSKLCQGIKTAEFDKLEYLGIFGVNAEFNFSILNARSNWSDTSRSSVSDIQGLSLLSDVTKQSIKYIYLNNNQITSINALKDFKNIKILFLAYNNIESLNGLENSTKLEYLNAYYNFLGKNESSERNDGTDSLCALKNMNSLGHLDLGNNQYLKWVDYIKNCSSLKRLYFDNCPNVLVSSVVELRSLMSKLIEVKYDAKFGLALIDEDITTLNLSNNEISDDVFRSLIDCKKLKCLNLANVNFYKLQDSNQEDLSEIELNTLINDVIKNFKGLDQLSLKNISLLKDISFVTNLTNLRCLDLRGTKVSTIQNENKIGLENLKELNNLRVLGVSDDSIDFSEIQDVISKLDGVFETGEIGSSICGRFALRFKSCYKNIGKL